MTTEPATIAPHLIELDLINKLHLLDRDDLTVDDIADLPEDLHYELIDGRLVLSPYALPIHQYISIRLGVALEEHCPEGVIVNGEQALLVNRRNEFRPDLMIIRDEGADRSPVLPSDVPLIIEIISKSSRSWDCGGKLKRHADLGIPAYWIIDPLAERVTFTKFSLGRDGTYERRLQTAELVTVDEPWEITLDLPRWTWRRDRIKRVGRRSG